MAFVQVDQALLTHRKTLRLARLLGMDRYATVGRLVALWTWCLDNALSGCLADIEPDILADVMGWEGKPADLVEGLLTSGFLELREGQLWVHDWDDHMGRLIERRKANAERMRVARARERGEPAVIGLDGDGSREPVDLAVGLDGEQEREQVEDTCVAAGSARALTVRATCSARAPAREEKEKRRAEQRFLDSEGIPEEKTRARSAHLARADAAPLSPGPLSEQTIEQTIEQTGVESVVRPPANVTPLAQRTRAADVVWDACVEHMGRAPSNRIERGKWNRGVAALKESGATAEEIAVRCGRYRQRFGLVVPLNPMALAGNWTELAVEVSNEPGVMGVPRRSGASSRRSDRSARPDISAPDYYTRPVAVVEW